MEGGSDLEDVAQERQAFTLLLQDLRDHTATVLLTQFEPGPAARA